MKARRRRKRALTEKSLVRKSTLTKGKTVNQNIKNNILLLKKIGDRGRSASNSGAWHGVSTLRCSFRSLYYCRWTKSCRHPKEIDELKQVWWQETSRKPSRKLVIDTLRAPSRTDYRPAKHNMLKKISRELLMGFLATRPNKTDSTWKSSPFPEKPMFHLFSDVFSCCFLHNLPKSVLDARLTFESSNSKLSKKLLTESDKPLQESLSISRSPPSSSSL